MILDVYKKIEQVVLEKFADLVVNTQIIHSPAGRARKLRIHLFDGTYIDIWYSLAKEYSYHWEQRPARNLIYRHDNAPHAKWKKVATFPKHFHNGSDEKIAESSLSSNPIKAIEEFMSFVREKLRS